MADIPEDINLSIEIELAKGKTAKEVSELFKVSYGKVVAIKNKMVEKKQTGELLTAVSQPALMQEVVKKLKEEMPGQVEQLQNLADGVSGLDLLQADFQETMSAALTKAKEYLSNPDLKVSEWKTLVDSMAEAYDTMFKVNGPQVLVNNSKNYNQTSVEKFGAFVNKQ